MQCLFCNEQVMLHWMLNIMWRLVSLSTMYGWLNLAHLESKLRLNHLRWYGHMERSDKWINKWTHLEIDGFKGRGRLLKTWSETVTEDLKAWDNSCKCTWLSCMEESTLVSYEKLKPKKSWTDGSIWISIILSRFDGSD